MVNAVAVQSLPRVGRKLRKPTHQFNVKYRPWALTPFMLAPVLPGDTMKNLLVQGKAISDPLKNPHMGWWNEMYFFYVKLRDLPQRTALEQMLIANVDPNLDTAANAQYYHNGFGINWTKMCLDQIVKHYFRSEEERESTDFANQTIFGYPQAKVNIDNWMESLTSTVDDPQSDGTPLPGDYFPDLPAHLSSFAAAYDQWKEMQHLNMAPPNFADYLKTAGVRLPKAEAEVVQKPELLRYVREWKMPSVVVDPATQSVGGSCVWDMAERADKDRFFAEPGFIIGIATARPKVLFSRQSGAMAHFLDDAFSWLPALLRPDPFTSLKKFTVGTGPIPLDGDPQGMFDYWVDLADLFMNGDQFCNFDLQGGGSRMPNIVHLPKPVNVEPDLSAITTPINKEYASDADALALFLDPTNLDTGANFIRLEGRCDVTILSSVTDTTP